MTKWHICPICKMGNPYDDEGVDCVDIMAHAAKWVTERPKSHLTKLGEVK